MDGLVKFTSRWIQSRLCYPKWINFRLNAACASLDEMITTSWFVLPPVQEYYFKSKHVSYNSLPPFKSNCTDPASIASMDIVYPKPNSKIYLPRNLDGTLGNTIFEAAHRSATAIVYWHLDGIFVTTTKKYHRLPHNQDWHQRPSHRESQNWFLFSMQFSLNY